FVVDQSAQQFELLNHDLVIVRAFLGSSDLRLVGFLEVGVSDDAVVDGGGHVGGLRTVAASGQEQEQDGARGARCSFHANFILLELGRGERLYCMVQPKESTKLRVGMI